MMPADSCAILSLTPVSALLAALTAGAMLLLFGCRAAQEAPQPPATGPADERDITITIVYDNNPGPKGLTSAWGFGCVVRGPEKTILFDTGGDGRVLLANMRQLGIDPNQIDAVVLSHIHGDHTGGLSSFLAVRGGVPVYVPGGFPAAFLERIRSLGARPVPSGQSQRVCPGVCTTGTLGKGQIEEHGLCVQTHKGGVVITGCAHPGVGKMAAEAKRLANGPIHLVLGGFHMGGQTDRQIHAVIDRFEALGISEVAPCHCTGDTARGLFKQRFAGRCVLAGVGSVFRFHCER